MVVSRLDDEANIAPWLRAADRFGATVKWAEIDIETGELPISQWEDLLSSDTRVVAIPSASSTLGTLVDVGAVAKLVHNVGGLVVGLFARCRLSVGTQKKCRIHRRRPGSTGERNKAQIERSNS